MNRIGLKVNGVWCVLPEDVSITIEEQNPLFSDSGSFSYPIELSVSQNRELFKSIDSPHGRIRPQDFDGLPFELWYDGTMLLYGSTETDEEMDVDDDKCSINLISGNGDFQSKIEGMQCTDVPLKGKVVLGHSYDEYIVFIGDSVKGQDYKYDLDMDYMMNYNANVSEPYSANYPYCNVRICSQRTDDYDTKKEVPYWVYEADRPWSGPCFYVAYFLDCLFYHLGFTVKENNMQKVEDMLRLAFFTTKCKYKVGEVRTVTSVDKSKNYMRFSIKHDNDDRWSNPRFVEKEIIATSDNFPSTDISSVLSSLFNAFGLKIVFDTVKNEVSTYYMRDILSDPEVIDVFMKVKGKTLSYEKTQSVKLTYGGDEKNTAFVYSDWSKLAFFSDYKRVVKRIGPYDKNCYISTKTGNKYRVKNDSEAEEKGNVKELNPSLFEVAQFPDYTMGEGDVNCKELKIGFSPIVENDVTGSYASKSDAVEAQVLAVYVDVEMTKPVFIPEDVTNALIHVSHRTGTYNESHGEYRGPYIRVWYQKVFNYDKTNNTESPFQQYDSGFTLGLMRGAGSNSRMEVVVENYDGNGNDAWVTVADDYAFTSDTMDAYGNRYDYNGTSPGGVADQRNSISLKTHVQTEKDVEFDDEGGRNESWKIDSVAAKRGLADRFMSEYMYFLLHRKTVGMDVDTTLSQLKDLSWFKQIKVNDTVGRLKSRKYTLTNKGISDMSIELYTLN